MTNAAEMLINIQDEKKKKRPQLVTLYLQF